MINKNLKALIGIVVTVTLAIIAGYTWYYFTHGTLEVSSGLKNTPILINGKDYGKGPIRLSLKTGHYTIATEVNPRLLTSDKKEVDLGYGKKEKVFVEIKLKKLTPDQISNLSEADKAEFTSLGQELTTQGEETMAQNNPLVKYLPYTDPSTKFKIDYDGQVINTKFTLTVYGNDTNAIKANQNSALNWIKSHGGDPLKINLQIIEVLTNDV